MWRTARPPITTVLLAGPVGADEEPEEETPAVDENGNPIAMDPDTGEPVTGGETGRYRRARSGPGGRTPARGPGARHRRADRPGDRRHHRSLHRPDPGPRHGTGDRPGGRQRRRRHRPETRSVRSRAAPETPEPSERETAPPEEPAGGETQAPDDGFIIVN